MPEIILTGITKTDINRERLLEELQAVNGWDGLSGPRLEQDAVWRTRVLFNDSAAPQDQEQARQIIQAHDKQALSADQQLRETVKAVAQSAVGIAFDQLTNTQLRALFAIFLWKEGALNNDGTVKPLGQWVRS